MDYSDVKDATLSSIFDKQHGKPLHQIFGMIYDFAFCNGFMDACGHDYQEPQYFELCLDVLREKTEGFKRCHYEGMEKLELAHCD